MQKGLIIVVILVVLAGLGYGGYKMMKKQPAAPSSVTTTMKPMATAKPSSMAMAMENSVYKMMQANKLGEVMTDPKGMTLYTYDKDTTGVSNCSGKCLVAWPAYVAASESALPANITVIKRTDGTMQYAWKGMPLYYYITDKAPGDVTGDMVGGVWHVIKNTK